MRSFFLVVPLSFFWFTIAAADSMVELQVLEEFFSKDGIESRSTRLTGEALDMYSRRPMAGEYLPKNTSTAFRLLVESETTAIYEAVVERDAHAEMWSAFFQRGVLSSKLEAMKSLYVPPFLVTVEYQRLLTQKGRSALQEARLTQLQRLLMTTEKFKDDFNQNKTNYETIARLVVSGKMDEADSVVKSLALIGVRLYGESKSDGEMALLVSASGIGLDKSKQPGCEIRVSSFLDSVLGLLYLPPGVTPPQMTPQSYIFVEAIADNWYLFRNIAAEPLKEKSEKYD